MSILKEANKRKVVAELEMLFEGMSEIIEKAKQGDIKEIPHKDLVEMDFPAKGFSNATFGENTVTFRVCHSELLDFMREKRGNTNS